MISKVIKQDIEQVLKREIRYPADCEVLEQDIKYKCNETVSASTLKRLFGLIKGNFEPRLYTLDVISKYLGFKNYDHYLEILAKKDVSEFICIEELIIQDLSAGDTYEFGYEPLRRIGFMYLGNGTSKILFSENSKLQANDVVKITLIALHYPLFISEVVRDNKQLGPYTAGKVSGITYIKKIE